MKDDKISGERIKQLHPKIRDEVKALIEKAETLLPKNHAVRIVQGYRTIAEQDALYAKGRTAPGKIVTKARGGSSYHNYGLAVDFAILIDKDNNGSYETLSWDDESNEWKLVIEVFKDSGYEWGGDWSSIVDAPHLQKSFGYTVKELFVMKKHNEDYIVFA